MITDTQETSFTASPRNNCDNVLNNHGKLHLQICKNSDLTILNGRTKGDSLGNVTFHDRNGVSTVNYVICNQNLFQKIEFFVVKPPTTISDHSQIATWLNSNTNTSYSANNGNVLDFQTLEKLPTQFVWNYNSDSLFKEALMSPQTQELIGDFMNCDFPSSETGVDEAVQSLENILCNEALQSLKRGKIKRRTKITNTVTKKWFDKECRLKRHDVRKLANAKHQDPTNIDIRKLSVINQI